MSPDPGLASWLQLSLTPGLGASTVRNLLKQFGLPEAVLARQRAELASFLVPAALEALPKITQIKELIITIGTEVGGELLVIDAQGIAHLMEEASYGVGTDDHTEVA